MTLVSYLKQGDQVLIGVNGRTMTVGPDHPNYTKVLQAISENNTKALPSLADVSESIREYSRGLITIDSGEVFYNETVLHNVICDRLVDMLKAEENIDPLVLFLENLMDNPSLAAINEMYLFMDANGLPITPDGYFLAYKFVNENYKDSHSNTFDNSIGAVVEMDRSDCDDDRSRTCSTGLHFCGLSYLRSFSGAHIMIVKINPRDVVSIPRDYDNAKGRACRYEVVGEHKVEGEQIVYETSAFDGPVDRRFTEGEMPTAEDVIAYKEQTTNEDGAVPFIKGLFTWFKSGSRN